MPKFHANLPEGHYPRAKQPAFERQNLRRECIYPNKAVTKISSTSATGDSVGIGVKFGVAQIEAVVAATLLPTLVSSAPAGMVLV